MERDRRRAGPDPVAALLAGVVVSGACYAGFVAWGGGRRAFAGKAQTPTPIGAPGAGTRPGAGAGAHRPGPARRFRLLADAPLPVERLAQDRQGPSQPGRGARRED